MEITIIIPEALVSKARSSGLSPETYIERLLDRIASASDRLDRDHEAATAGDYHRQTGSRLDGDEIDAWMAQLESSDHPHSPAPRK